MPPQPATRKPTKDGFVRLTSPEGATQVSHDGDVYTVEDGAVDVPQGAVYPLLSHGFTRADGTSSVPPAAGTAPL